MYTEYTDEKLALKMQSLLIQHVIPESKPREPDLMTELMKDKTEENVRTKLITGSFTDTGLKGKFNRYWSTLGAWLKQQGGDLSTLNGRAQAGRTGGNVTDIAKKALYDDAFMQTQKYINTQDFSVCKAISNHLRFIAQFI